MREGGGVVDNVLQVVYFVLVAELCTDKDGQLIVRGVAVGIKGLVNVSGEGGGG